MTTTTADEEKDIVEERVVRTDSIFLRARTNHRLGLMRIVDYRAGFLPSKRLHVQHLARTEGAMKALVFVEKDEVSSWTKLGFAKEGSIPGFYKRSDAHLCGMAFDADGDTIQSKGKPAPADKLVTDARKASKKLKAAKGITLRPLNHKKALQARDKAWEGDEAFAAFDAFEQDGDKLFFEAVEGKDVLNIYSAEVRDCFGHAYLEILRRPADENDLARNLAALKELMDDLEKKGILSFFTFSPGDDSEFAVLLLALGFRRTGFIQQAMMMGGKASDVFVWARKLAGDD